MKCLKGREPLFAAVPSATPVAGLAGWPGEPEFRPPLRASGRCTHAVLRPCCPWTLGMLPRSREATPKVLEAQGGGVVWEKAMGEVPWERHLGAREA